MVKNKASNRSKKFISRNSLSNDKVKEYVNNLACCVFDFKDFDFVNINNCIAFHLLKDGQNLYLYLDEELIELKLMKGNIEIKKFTNDSCWYQGLKFICQNSFEKKGN